MGDSRWRAKAATSARGVAMSANPCFALTASDRRKSSPQARFRQPGYFSSSLAAAYSRSASVIGWASVSSRSIRIVPLTVAAR